MAKKIIRLTEQDLNKIVKESVKRIQEAYGTPAKPDAERQSSLIDAQSAFGAYDELSSNKNVDRITKEISNIIRIADELGNSAFVIGAYDARYSSVLRSLSQKVRIVGQNMANQEQMKTGEQPVSMGNFRYWKRKKLNNQ
jgi:uncharacterized membrane protein YheB (UPF0754 family)